MTSAAKAIIGIGSLCTIAPTSYVAYRALSSNNSIGRKGLENSGYSLEPPTLKQNDLGDSKYACADRLFKEMKVSGMKPESSDTTVYGCAIMRLETDTSGKFSDFGSNIAIRKGDKGWIINVSASSSGMIGYFYIELTYSGNEWTQESWVWNEINNSDDSNKTLIIKVPEESNSWFEGNVNPADQVNPSNKSIKEFSKAWISDDNGTRDWILKGMMVARGSEDKSQIFCSNEKTRISECFKDLEVVRNVNRGTGGFKGAKKETNTGTTTDIPKNEIKKTYQELSSSKGSWTELSEICSYGKDGNIDEDKQKKLEMFCAIVPPKVNIRPLPPMPTPPPPSESRYS